MNVFLFPGQGSQEVGMGSDLLKSGSSLRDLIALASHQVGADLEHLCRRGPERQLRQSRYLQPLLVAVSLGYSLELTRQDTAPDLVLGHSLGEISALGAAGVLTPEEAVLLAVERGQIMEEAAQSTEGGMVAVTTNTREELLQHLSQTSVAPEIWLANDNAPTQLIFSGRQDALDAFANEVQQKRLGHCRHLPVAGPWHTPLMRDAGEQFTRICRQTPFKPARVPLILNATATAESSPEPIRNAISQAIANPVRWRECADKVKEAKPSTLIEVGPGRVLTGLARLNGADDNITAVNANNLRGVQRAVEACQRSPKTA